MSNKGNIIKEFKGITGSDEIFATNMLEACNWNLEISVNMYLESVQDKVTFSNSNNSNSEVHITASASVRLANVCLYRLLLLVWNNMKKFWKIDVWSQWEMCERDHFQQCFSFCFTIIKILCRPFSTSFPWF